MPIDKVLSEVLVESDGPDGSAGLEWPEDLETQLGAQLNLLAYFADGHEDAAQFAYHHFYAGDPNINNNLHSMTDHLFEPMVEDLLRYLRRNQDQPISTEQATAPAADRIVSVDHNSQGYEATRDALSALEGKLEGWNELNVDDRKRMQAEIGAARKLLDATKVRLEALATLLVKTLKWLTVQFSETAVGIAAGWTIAKIVELIPDLHQYF
ncbi:hypothetical protein QBK99_05215 [Corticibacterium sp. UT-5YL-CI-8]|nr:hypothetical protein [Tianweitania sp. UT-5YL-CI-8]